MKIKELNNFRRKIFDEITKNKEVKEALKHEEEIYIFSIEENEKHKIIIFKKLTHINKECLQQHGFTENASITKLYTINKQTKQCI